MNKKIFLLIGLITFGMILPSCSKDDEPQNGNGGVSTVLPVPGAVVDGVRLTDMGSLGNVSYNSDGSISKVVLNGITYKFEYASRGNAVTGPMLKAIKVSTDEEFDVYEITDYKFNSKRFVTQWTEHWENLYKDEYGNDEYEKATAVYTPEYNNDGRISKLNAKGKTEYFSSEYGHETYNTDIELEYTYDGGKLISSSLFLEDDEGDGDSGWSIYKLSYNAEAPENTFNIAPWPLCNTMSHGRFSYGAKLFAMLGYLGIPSSHLPTSETYTYAGEKTQSCSVSYVTDKRNQVTSVTLDYGWGPNTFEMSYVTLP